MAYDLDEAFDNDSLSEKFAELDAQDSDFIGELNDVILDTLKDTEHEGNSEIAAFILRGFLSALIWSEQPTGIAEVDQHFYIDSEGMFRIRITAEQAVTLLSILLEGE